MTITGSKVARFVFLFASIFCSLDIVISFLLYSHIPIISLITVASSTMALNSSLAAKNNNKKKNR